MNHKLSLNCSGTREAGRGASQGGWGGVCRKGGGGGCLFVMDKRGQSVDNSTAEWMVGWGRGREECTVITTEQAVTFCLYSKPNHFYFLAIVCL